MPNIIGKIGGFVTSMISNRDLPTDVVASNQNCDEEEIPSIVKDCRGHLINAIHNGEPTENIIQNLLTLECSKPEDKYFSLRVVHLIELNNKSLQGLRNILTGLSFIVKYARHLIKEPDKRTGQWRNIHFNNAYFIRKIKPLNGYEMILEQLGYTEHVDFGLKFPLNKEPDRNKVVSLIADMMLLKRELKDYFFDKHPHKHQLENLLPQQTRDEVLAFRLSGLKIEDDINEVSGQSSIADFDQLQRMSFSVSNSSQNVNNNAGHEKMQCFNGLVQLTDTVSAIDDVHKDEIDTISPAKEIQTQELVLEAQAIQDLVNPQETSDAVPLASSECSSSSSRRLVCSVCGEDASLFCAECTNKLLCDTCNKNWHKHPSRQNHKTEPVSALASINADTSMLYVYDPTYGVCAQVSPSHAKVGRKQQTYVIDPNKDLKKADSGQPASNVPDLTRLFPDLQSTDPFNGTFQSMRKNFPQMPDDHQILDYQRNQQKMHFPFPPNLSTLDLYGMPTEQAYYSQHPRNMFTTSQMYHSRQPIPQHLLNRSSDSPEYVMQQLKDQENRQAYNHPALRNGNLTMYGHGMSQPYVRPQMSSSGNSSFGVGTNSLFQSTAPFFSPQENQNKSYNSPYHGPVPLPGNYMPDYSIGDEFSHYPNPSGFTPHTLSKSYSPGVRPQQNSRHLLMTGHYQNSPDLNSDKFIRRLMQEPDPLKRRSKCETYIEDLDMDLKELENDINNKLLEFDEFSDSEVFKEMVNRKKAMMKEKKNLETFRGQLANESLTKTLPSGKNAYQPHRQQDDMKQQIFYPPDIDNAVLKQSQLVVGNAGQLSVVPEAVYSSHGNLSAPKPPTANRIGVSVPGVSLLTAGGGENMNTVSQQIKVNTTVNSSREPGITPIERTPVESSTEERFGQLESVHPIEARQTNSVELLNRISTPPSKPSIQHGLYQNSRWQCEHCTFINEAGSHVCSMCDKTSFNPQLLQSLEELPLFSERQGEISLGDEDPLLKLLLDDPKVKNDKEDPSDIDNDPDQTTVVAMNIGSSQNQVMMEKKKAQKEFQQFVEEQNKTLSSDRSLSPKGNQSYSLGARPKEIAAQNVGRPLEEFHTPPSSMSNVSVNTVKNSEVRKNNLEDTLAMYTEQKVIDTMKGEGMKLAKLVKMADQQGYDVEAVKVALTFCDQQAMTPLEWLKANWKKNVAKVMNMATVIGNGQQCNSVGELTESEAEEGYISCHGNIREAAQYCVKKRSALFEYLSKLGQFPREEILHCMFQCQGSKDESEKLLQKSNLQHFLDHIWAQKDISSSSQFTFQDLSSPDICHSLSTSVIGHSDFQRMIKDKNIPVERRTRLILVEGCLKSWGRAELVIKLLDSDLDSEVITVEDIVEAVRNCQDRQSAIAYLQQECQLCFTPFPMSKIRNLNFCQCKMCQDCLSKNFEVAIREKHVRHWTCPLCAMPDLNDADVASDYLQFLTLLLQPLIDPYLQNLFEIKVRDWHLQKDPNFRWCAHCAEGFLAENRGHHLRMTCPHCGMKTCFSCKREWEDQHELITCEQFAQWKIDNDPNNQSVGLAKHLDENGIDCPMCKMRFSLAKGGCMHFKCPQCGHEFCSGCNEPYHQKDVCTKYKGCKNQGFHCHCPRDCFSYLRDYTVEQLQNLLNIYKVEYNTKPPQDQHDTKHCPVMEQKEFDMMKKDEKCGKKTIEGQAGLCELHYKEYLVYIINKNKLDPVVLMSKDQMIVLIRRYDIKVPQQKTTESSEAYVATLTKVIKEKLPLRRQ
ncbi:E3 ubiquitin-protein ligase rnf31 [Bulinus truncatus]|nr:E3 ubiquitin-protein ligase rnf31 [Bulinus truncatus]